MRTKLRFTILISSLLVANQALAIDVDNPKKYLKENFWGNLYKEGGTTLFCNKSFKRKGILIDESYIYSDSWIRDELDCGSPRQCRKNDAKYRSMISDMHNIYPAQSRFELKRKGARFEELGTSIESGKCGIKRSFDLMEPAKEIKGDIARAIFYMHSTYSLPIVGSMEQLKRWHKIDPVSSEEAERNKRISEIQGNGNAFITSPSEVYNLH